MKFSKTILAVAALGLLASLPAFAQFNTFGETRTVILAPPTKTLGSEGATIKSNACIDTIGYEGVAIVNLIACTNAGGGTLTATLLTSKDQVTWTALANYALASQADIIYTNRYYGTNGLTATNTFVLPGTVVTPTAATAGFATPYLNGLATPFTNSGTINMVASAKPIVQVAYNVQDADRYLQVLWTYGGTTTNVMHCATLTARKQQFP